MRKLVIFWKIELDKYFILTKTQPGSREGKPRKFNQKKFLDLGFNKPNLICLEIESMKALA